MKQTITIFLIGILIGYVSNHYTGNIRRDTAQELIKIAQRIQKEEDEARARAVLQARVEKEAKRFNVGVQKFPVIRDILLVWGDDYRVGLAIAYAESGLRCEAYHFNDNGSIDFSAMQLNSVHSHRGNLADCHENVRIAYEIYKESGPSPWVVWNRNIAQKYL